MVLPMSKWKEIEDAFEDLEMYTSTKLRRDIARARGEKKDNHIRDAAEEVPRITLRRLYVPHRIQMEPAVGPWRFRIFDHVKRPNISSDSVDGFILNEKQ